MQDKKTDQQAGSSQVISDSSLQNLVTKQATVQLHEFFAHIIPEPIDSDLETNLKADEEFSQLLASSISLSIDEYHDKLLGKSELNTSNLALQASSLIGRNVLVQNGRIYLEDNQHAEAFLELERDCVHILVYVENEQGEIVKLLPLGDCGPGQLAFSWDGSTRTGDVAAEGDYRFIVSCLCDGKVIELIPFTNNKVIRVSVDKALQDLRLYLENDDTLMLSEVSQIVKQDGNF
ncbi:flagellar hook assembly protein FlgD [Thalassotalea sp. HSM 43]|uniref:flagellar hook assembly protein FlgD n=1 Tax=Thalassotalea sp. HSM 43 TaxID=2552945 RepID=UPI001679974B|nr:FlgD immunoglobulin-like domain containing protein [Thalassotalea sp. HSM 43]